MYVCVPVASIVLWIDLWKLRLFPIRTNCETIGDTTAAQNLSGSRRELGALQPFDRISRKQVGVDPFATVFWKTG